MARRNRPQGPRRSPDLSVEEATSRRDEGRIRVRNTTLWAVAATVVGTAVLGAGYAYAIPGSTTPHPSPAQPPATAPSGRVIGPPATSQPSTTAPSPSATPTTPGHRTTTAKPAKPSRSAKPSRPSASLQPPAQPPAPTTQPPQTTTGGS